MTSPLRLLHAMLACVSLTLAGGLGCVSGRSGGPPPSEGARGGSAIDEVNLLAIPVAINLDDVPGVDGFVIKIYATNRKRPKPFPIERGQVEVFMFDGIPSGGGEPPQPLRTWSYTAAELKAFEIRTSIGTGYQLALAWGDAAPTGSKISVVAQYTSPGGQRVFSAPSVIAVALK